ncbi:MAG: multidrug effflux MFS transporter [Gammaproteobacteria bacterium]
MENSIQLNKKKITLLVMWMTALSQAAMALYLPSFPAIAKALTMSPAAIKNSITIYLIGFGVSQIIYGPLSDRYGRKPILLLGILIFCLGCFINIIAKIQTVFLFARLLQGIGCGSILTNGRSILRDCFCGRDLASAASYASMGFAIGFGASPIIGAYLSQYLGWQADFIFLLLAGFSLIFILGCWLPETRVALDDKSGFQQFLKDTLDDYKIIISHRVFLQLLLGGLFAYAVIIAYNVMTPFLIQNILGYSASTYGWLAVIVAVPYYTAASVNRELVKKFGTGPIFALGALLIILSGAAMAITSLYAKIYLAYIIVPMMIATFGQALIFSNTIAMALHHFSAAIAGKASALFSSLQIIIIGVFSAVMAILPDNNQLPLALVIVCLGLLASVVLWKHLK